MSKLLSMMIGKTNYILNPIFTTVGTNIVIDSVTGEITGFTARPSYHYIYAEYTQIANFGLDKNNKIIFSVADNGGHCIVGLGYRWTFNCWNGNFRISDKNNAQTVLYNGIVANTRYRIEYFGNYSSGIGLTSITWTLYNDETNTQLGTGTTTVLPNYIDNPAQYTRDIYIGIKKDNYADHYYQDALNSGKIYAGTIIGGKELLIRG